jgi:hypothetical protein
VLLVLMLKMSGQETMADQVITGGPELSLCLFVQCWSHLTSIQNFGHFW